jgi:hypothetical protein
MEVFMYKKNIKKVALCLVILSLTFWTINCGKDEPTRPQLSPVPLETLITAGPSDGENLIWGATATFTWKGEVYPGDIFTFEYTFTSIVGGDTTVVTAQSLQRSISYSDLQQGDYQFSVAALAIADDDTLLDESPAARSFAVIVAEQAPPSVEITSGPKEKSFAATNADMFFSWQGTPQAGREMGAYSYRLNVNGAEGEWSEWAKPYVNTAYNNLANGKYSFQVRARDNAGQESNAERQFQVKNPDILFAIEGALTSDDLRYWHDNVLKDFAYEDYTVSDAASFITKLDANVYSTVVWAWKNDYSAVLDSANFSDVTSAGTIAEALYSYEQAGGHLWIMGSEIMWGLDDMGAIVTGESAFATQVLHCASYNEDDANFQGANSVGVGNYNSIVVDGNATFAWCDQIDPTTDAETILTFSSGVFEGQSTAVRYPAGAANPGEVKVIFCGFYITDSTQPAAVKATDIYQLATTIFDEFGENLDW